MAWTLVQQSAAQTTNGTNTLPANSTAGNLLIAVVTNASATALSPPASWSTGPHIANGVTSETYIFIYFNNPGGLSSFTFTGGSGAIQVSVAEFTCPSVSSVAATSATGTNTAGSVTSITVTNGAGELSGDLVIVAAMQHVSAAAALTWTDPSGFTEFSSLSLASANNHGYGAYELSGSGASQAATVTSTLTGTATGWTGAIASFTQPGPAAPVPVPYITQQSGMF